MLLLKLSEHDMIASGGRKDEKHAIAVWRAGTRAQKRRVATNQALRANCGLHCERAAGRA